MNQELEKLLIIQDRDRKIRTMRAELKAAPLERKHLEDRLAAAGAKLDAAKLSSKEIEVERKRLEVEAEAKRGSIAKFKTQQFQTRKNDEFQALANEIKRFESDVEKLEDRELELMEQAEAMKNTVSEAEQNAKTAQSQVRTQIADLEKKIQAIESGVAELEAERSKLTVGVDEDALDLYERLFASKGDLAIVALKHEVCTGCHMKITTQTAVRVKGSQELVACEQCGRLLYHED
jgi:hypothetical protein